MYLIDSNIIIDILNEGTPWSDESATLLTQCADEGPLVINAIIFAEISAPFESLKHCKEALTHLALLHEPIPEEAAFLAGKAFLRYRKSGGRKHAPLPDFFIGAHALTEDYTLVTRDKGRYKTYFPTLPLLMP